MPFLSTRLITKRSNPNMDVSEPRFAPAVEVCYMYMYVVYRSYLGCGLRGITRSLKVPNHEIHGAQYLNLRKKLVFPVTLRQKFIACGTWALLKQSQTACSIEPRHSICNQFKQLLVNFNSGTLRSTPQIGKAYFCCLVLLSHCCL